LRALGVSLLVSPQSCSGRGGTRLKLQPNASYEELERAFFGDESDT